jgi:hypothetical protein
VIEAGENLVKIDFVVAQGSAKGHTWLAVYYCNGDELKCNLVSDRCARPTALATKPGDYCTLHSLKYEKK